MRQNLQLVLGDVFAPADVLTVDVRLRLSDLLAVPGRAPAILAKQLAALPLPADREVLSALRSAIETGLRAPALAALAGLRLDAVVPVLSGLDVDAVARFVRSSLRGVLAEHANASTLGALTIGQLCAWPGLGTRRVGGLVAAAVAAGLELVGSDDATPAPVSVTADDVSVVLDFDEASGGALRRRLAGIANVGPSEVRSAAGRLLAVPASRSERCVAFLEAALASVGDVRDRGVFEHGVLPLGAPVSRGELAVAVGVGVERIRQLGVRAVGRVDAFVDDAPAAVREVAATVAERLGSAVPVAVVAEVLVGVGLPALPDSRSRLLVWIAGPYRTVAGQAGWVALDPAELVRETRRMIGEDGGVRLVDHVAKELHTLGMAAGHVEAWLAGQPVRVSDGLVVLVSGAPGDVAERVLHACGRPLVMEEMAMWMTGGWDGAEALWSVPDRRFVVTDDDALALVEWGDAAEGVFAGWVDGSTGQMGERAVTLRVEVDRDVLDGQRAPVPVSLAHALELGRGSRRTFTSRFGPVVFAYDTEVPFRGSMRAVALAVGAAVGDEVVFTLYPDGNGADVSLVRSTWPDPGCDMTLRETCR